MNTTVKLCFVAINNVEYFLIINVTNNNALFKDIALKQALMTQPQNIQEQVLPIGTQQFYCWKVVT